MDRHEFVTVSVRLLGVALMALALPTLGDQATAIVERWVWFNGRLGWVVSNFPRLRDNYGISVGLIGAAGLQFGVGAHLFWGGRRLMRRIARVNHSECPRCGYDLRGAEHAGVCPECGSVRGGG